jgi:hypothetical protein
MFRNLDPYTDVETTCYVNQPPSQNEDTKFFGSCDFVSFWEPLESEQPSIRQWHAWCAGVLFSAPNPESCCRGADAPCRFESGPRLSYKLLPAGSVDIWLASHSGGGNADALGGGGGGGHGRGSSPQDSANKQVNFQIVSDSLKAKVPWMLSTFKTPYPLPDPLHTESHPYPLDGWQSWASQLIQGEWGGVCLRCYLFTECCGLLPAESNLYTGELR